MFKSLIVGLAVGAVGSGSVALGASLGFTSFETIWPAGVICAVLSALVHDAKHAITGLVDNRASTLRKRIERTHRDVGDIHGLVRLGPYTQALPLPIGGGWALTGDSAAILAREVLVRDPETILELGSGTSTLILGQILKKGGKGRLLSVDHDPLWANQTRRYVEFLGLQDVVTVVDAPLKDIAMDKQMFDWYDIPVSELDQLGSIDLLLVDGPPQGRDTAIQARYPAFPLLYDRLSRHALIFVDDARREAELKMVEKWKADHPGWHSQFFDTVDGVCILTRVQ